MRYFNVYALCILAALTGSALFAQTPGIPDPDHEAKASAPNITANTITTWSNLYYSGDWPGLQEALRNALAPLVFVSAKTGPSDSFDLAARPYSVVFMSTFVKPKGEVIRVVLQPRPIGKFSVTLPGVMTHYELYVHPDRSQLTLKTVYVSTKTDNPLTAQLAGFVKLIDMKSVGSGIVGLDGKLLSAKEKQDIKDCQTGVYKVDLRQIRLPFANATIAVADDIVDDDCPGLAVSGKTSYNNVPFSHVSLGVVAGVITSQPSKNTRVKLGSNGNLTEDPLTTGTPITIAAVNLHPVAFSPGAPALTPAERFSGFVGIVASPEIGIAAGLKIGIVRGLSFDAGYGVLRINKLRKGDALNAAPTEKAHPYRNGKMGAVFFGFGYSIK
jgi:hypothetical protein